MRTPVTSPELWAQVFSTLGDASHLVTGEDLSAMLEGAVRPLGLTAEVFLVDLPQRALAPVHPDMRDPVPVDGTLPGRAYQFGEILPGTGDDGERLLWIPLLDGTERVGLLRIGFGPDTVEDGDLRRRLWSLSGLMGHIVVTKIPYSDHLRRLRGAGVMSEASELLWQLLPPRTFATENTVVTALLEPAHEVAGDAYDYAVDSGSVDLAVFDGLGHDLPATQITALALTAVRNARRRTGGERDLTALAAHADRLISGQAPEGRTLFVTAVLARLDTRTGELSYLLAGHPPPLLFRNGRLIKELGHEPRPPLGFAVTDTAYRARVEQLEPGDRVLFYSDGVTEARDATGVFFGEKRLVDLAERAALDDLSAPETLRRLGLSVLAHQSGRSQDDMTLLMLEWSATGPGRMLPTFS